MFYVFLYLRVGVVFVVVLVCRDGGWEYGGSFGVVRRLEVVFGNGSGSYGNGSISWEGSLVVCGGVGYFEVVWFVW